MPLERSADTTDPAILPTPAYVTVLFSRSRSATAAADPRPPDSLAWKCCMASQGCSNGLSAKAAAAPRDEAAANEPWPKPSAIIMATIPPRSAILQVSPHSISPARATQMAPNSMEAARRLERSSGERLPLEILETATVPRPISEYTSKNVDRREMAPSPVPAVPAVEWP